MALGAELIHQNEAPRSVKIKHFQLGAEFVFVYVPSLWVPSLQGAEVVGAEFERCRVCWCRVCKVPKCPVFVGIHLKMLKLTSQMTNNGDSLSILVCHIYATTGQRSGVTQ